MATKMAKPRAASQAPRDRRRKIKNNLFRWVRQCMMEVNAVRVRSNPSVARRTIKRWARWAMNRIIHMIIGRGIRAIEGVSMAGGLGPISGLQDQCLQ